MNAMATLIDHLRLLRDLDLDSSGAYWRAAAKAVLESLANVNMYELGVTDLVDELTQELHADGGLDRIGVKQAADALVTYLLRHHV